MTSMPASRRARAIIFAPRSWPSSPGLAIKTRIFFGDIRHENTAISVRRIAPRLTLKKRLEVKLPESFMNEEVDAVVTALERAPSIVIPLVREVPESILKRRPKPGKWSAH